MPISDTSNDRNTPAVRGANTAVKERAMAEKLSAYVFEQAEGRVRSRRTRDDAERELDILLHRLAVAEAHVQGLKARFGTILVRCCMDFHLNIEWYDIELGKLRRRQRRQVWATLVGWGAFLVLLAVLSMLPVSGPDAQLRQGAWVAQSALLLGVALGLMQAVAATMDEKARIAVFWQATSDLKEALYTFEETWRGRVVDGDGAVSDAFEAALLQELRNARKIAQSERRQYFDTFRSPTEVNDVVKDVVKDALGRRQDFVTAAEAARARRVAKETEMTEQIDKLRVQMHEAQAEVAATEYKLAELRRLGAPENEIRAAEETMLTQNIAVTRLRALLKSTVKGDTLNPP